MRLLLLRVLIGCAALVVTSAPAAAQAATSVKTVRYRGYAVRVPAGWPVFKLASDPSACVRFDRHAVYLGRPTDQERCPAHAVGRTEAVLLAPASPQVQANVARGQVHQITSGALTLAHGRVLVTATWSHDPQTIERALRLRGLPAAAAAPPTAAGAGGAAPAAATPPASATMPAAPPLTQANALRTATATTAAAATVHPHTVNIGGLGFDTCQAPSATDMSAWLSASPFRAAAIYIGGANSACAQPNLTAAWVSAESAAGWQLIPVYVGLQAPTSSCGCKTISSSQAAAQGTAAALDAVAQAEALGIGAGNPIYDDMESYTRTSSSTAAVLSFLTAWTAGLHAYGYVSGVYGSGLSGITDLVAAQGTTVGTGPFVEPDDIWIADWNDKATASDSYVPAADWADNQRLHQYRGGHVDSYGGVKLDVDSDYLDGATATAGTASTVTPTLADGTFVSYKGKTYRIAGGAPLYVHSWSAFGGRQPTVALTAAQWEGLSTLPADGTFIRATGTGQTYRIAGGAPVIVRSWTPFGGPQPVVIVDAWNIQHAGNATSHLVAAPRSGTIVEGLPSDQYWLFGSGWRTATAASASAVGVPDGDLSKYLEAPVVSRDVISGVAKRSPQLRIVLTAGANAPALKTFVLSLPPGLSFSSSSAELTRGVIMWWARDGRPLTRSTQLSGGRLTITLATPQRKVLIAVNSPALATGRALASQVKRGNAALSLTVTATDVKRDVDSLALSPKVS